MTALADKTGHRECADRGPHHLHQRHAGLFETKIEVRRDDQNNSQIDQPEHEQQKV